MSYDISKYLVIGISSRALFDLTYENDIFDKQGIEAYAKYQIEHEDEILEPGVGFNLIKALLNLNEKIPNKRKTEVIIMSHNSADTSLRIFNSIEHHRLDIKRAALTSGRSIAPYLKAFKVDLFLSAYEDDVQQAIDANTAAGLIYNNINEIQIENDEIRIAFDGDAVIFSDESERIYQEKGLDEFIEYEKRNARKPLPEGPFAKLLKSISYIQNETDFEEPPFRTALVTSRNSPAHERVIRTLREWKIRIDEAFFMGGIEKTEVLRAFKPHIFFDDQDVHCKSASFAVPSARVPYKQKENVNE